MQNPYYRSILLIERLHRHFLEVVKTELDRQGLRDINNVQGLILYNIGADELTVGELTARGYYLGSNVSYNVKKLVEAGYLLQERSQHDRRSIRLRLSDKGMALRGILDGMLQGQAEALGEIDLDPARLSEINEALMRLEGFWARRVGYALGGLTAAA